MANKRFIYNKDKHEKMIGIVLESGIGEQLSVSFPGFSVTHVVNRFRKEGRMNDYLMLKKLAFGGLTVIPSRKDKHVEYVIHVRRALDRETGIVRNYICDYREMRYLPEKGCYKVIDSISIRKQLERIGVPEARWNEYLKKGCLDGPVGEGKVVTCYPDGMPIEQDIDNIRSIIQNKYQHNAFHFNGRVFNFTEQEGELFANGYAVTLSSGGLDIDVRYNVFAGGLTPCYELGRALRMSRENKMDEGVSAGTEQKTVEQDNNNIIKEHSEETQTALTI